MIFNWEINPATLLGLAVATLGIVRYCLTAENMAKAAAKAADEAADSARLAHEKIALLQSAMSAYRETQAERLVSREVLREVEDRLTGAIEKLGDRLDSLVKEMITHRQG